MSNHTATASAIVDELAQQDWRDHYVLDADGAVVGHWRGLNGEGGEQPASAAFTVTGLRVDEPKWSHNPTKTGAEVSDEKRAAAIGHVTRMLEAAEYAVGDDPQAMPATITGPEREQLIRVKTSGAAVSTIVDHYLAMLHLAEVLEERYGARA